MYSSRLKPRDRSLVQGPFSLDFSCYQLVDACGSQPNCWLQFLHSWDKQHASLNLTIRNFVPAFGCATSCINGRCMPTNASKFHHIPSLPSRDHWAPKLLQLSYWSFILGLVIWKINLPLHPTMIPHWSTQIGWWFDDSHDIWWWYFMIFHPLLLQACTCSHGRYILWCGDYHPTATSNHPIQCTFLSVQSPSRPSSTAFGMSATDAVQGPPLLHQLGPVESHASVAVSVRVYLSTKQNQMATRQ